MAFRNCRALSVVLAVALLMSTSGSISAARSTLHIPWPAGWEYQAPVEKNGVTYLQARSRRGGHVEQTLQLEIIHATSAVTPASLRELVQKLAGARAAKPDVQALELGRGYFFVDRARPPDRTQRVEGALVADEHFIHFMLFTSDPAAVESKKMIAVLGRARISVPQGGGWEP